MNNNTLSAEMKVCTLCHETFPATLDYFGTDRKARKGLSSRCKGCLKRLRETKKDIKREYDKQRLEFVGDIRRQQARDYYHNHKEQKSEYDREYREKNKEKRLQQKRNYYLNNREHCLRKNKEIRERNKEYYFKYRMEYYQKNKDEIKRKVDEWRKNNPDKFNIVSQRRKARKRKLDNNFTINDWNRCKDYFGNKCAYCGKKCEKLTQEHFIPLNKGGEYTVNNIIPACRRCNSSKQDKDFFFWYPLMTYYSVTREKEILKYLGYKNDNQQLALFK